jgi:hypothetical protein
MRAAASAVLALALLSACKSAAPKPEAPATGAVLDPAVFYPLAVGNEWTYDLGGERRETIRIVGRDGAWFLDDHRGRLRVEREGVRDADRFLLHTPLQAGAKWTAVENLVVQRFEVVSTQASAVTRAGTFTGCAVVRNEQPLDSRRKFVTEWTYAPGVGLVELRTRVVGADGKAQDQTHLELVAYHVQPL